MAILCAGGCVGGEQTKVVCRGVSEIRYVGNVFASRRAQVARTGEKLDTEWLRRKRAIAALAHARVGRLCEFYDLDDRFHEPDHGTGDLLVDSSFAVR